MPDFNTNLGALGMSITGGNVLPGTYTPHEYTGDPSLLMSNVQPLNQPGGDMYKQPGYVRPPVPAGIKAPVGVSTSVMGDMYNTKTGQRYVTTSGGYSAEPGSGWVSEGEAGYVPPSAQYPPPPQPPASPGGALPSNPSFNQSPPNQTSPVAGNGNNMALLDFLTEGAPIPATSGIIDKNTVNTLPDWYTNYAMDLLGKQTNVLNTPYATNPAPRVAGFTGDQNSAFDATRTAATAGQPTLNSAVAATSNFTSPGGLAAAQPYLNKAANTSVSGLDQYMNPYTQNVVDRMGDVAGRTLREKLLPAVNDSFISAGQAGSSRNAEILGRTLRDVSESTTAAQKGALQEGYGQAMTASAADLSRQATLGQTAGELTQRDATSGLSAAGQLGTLAEQQQKMGLTGAGALSTIGGQQQNLNQQNLDIAQQDFLRQQGWPQDQIDRAMAAISGVKGAVPTATKESGVTPIANQGYQPSGLSQIGSTATGIAAILAAINGK